MDDRVIDFNELKNKVKEKDVDKFESYIYSLYYDMAQGKLTMSEMTKGLREYMDQNNISQDKFIKMQKKLMERYGFDTGAFDDQLKALGLDTTMDMQKDYEKVRKTIGFKEKYKGDLVIKSITEYKIKNSINDIVLLIDGKDIIIRSEGKVSLEDNELNEFLCSYKKVNNDDMINISIFENVKTYNY